MPSYKDKNTGKWFCKFYYEDYTGIKKQKKKSGFRTKKESVEWERDFLQHMQATPDITFRTLYDQYMVDISHRLRENSVRGKACLFKTRILPYFENKPINEITPRDIREWQNEQIARGYSDAYLDRIQSALTTILNFAVTYYNLPTNPCDKAGHMGKRTRSMNFWTIDQYRLVYAAEDNETVKIALQMLFYSGVRFGELLALTVNDCDFAANTINIDKSLQYFDASPVITPPKTDNGIRVINMPTQIMSDLQFYINKNYGMSGNDRIFLFTKSLIRNHMKRSAEKAGVPRIRIHDLRHSHVSLLIELGFSPHLIADRIGDTV